ncbi:ankyrin repeat domain-containing protein, partial [Chlamydiia bacterium]|nr:ankyrin repeat domain-containing protein [Chlamydiia bacterium]
MHNLLNCNVSHNPDNNRFALTNANIPEFHIRLHHPDIHNHEESKFETDQIKSILNDELKSLATVKIEQFTANYFHGHSQAKKQSIVFKGISDAITFLTNPCIDLDENKDITLSIAHPDAGQQALSLINMLFFMIYDEKKNDNDDDIIAYINALHLNGLFTNVCNRRNIFLWLMRNSHWKTINHILRLKDTNGDFSFNPNISHGDKQKPMLIEFMLKEAPINEFEFLLDHPMINPNIMERTILNPLKLATELSQPYFKTLLNHPDININAQDHLKNTAAHLCAAKGHIERLIALINASTNIPLDLDVRNKDGFSVFDTLIRSKADGDTFYPHHPLLNCFSYDHIELFRAVLDVVFFDFIESEKTPVLYEDLLTVIFKMESYTVNQRVMIDHLLNHGLVDLSYCNHNICGQVPFIDFVKANCRCEDVKKATIKKYDENNRITQGYYEAITADTEVITTDTIPKKIQTALLRQLIRDNHGDLLIQFINAQNIDLSEHLDGYILLTQCFKMDKSPTKKLIRWIIPHVQDDSLNMIDDDGQNLLHRSIYHEKPDVVDALLSNRCTDVNEVNYEGVAPIILSLGGTCFKSLAFHNKTELNDVTLDGTPLISLCIKGIYTTDGFKECFNTLCEEGRVNLNIKSEAGLTPLHYAITRDDTNAFHQLLIDPRVNKNAATSDEHLFTPLMLAVFCLSRQKHLNETTDYFSQLIEVESICINDLNQYKQNILEYLLEVTFDTTDDDIRSQLFCHIKRVINHHSSYDGLIDIFKKDSEGLTLYRQVEKLEESDYFKLQDDITKIILEKQKLIRHILEDNKDYSKLARQSNFSQ